MVYYILAFIVFLLDQGTKYLIATRMELREEIPVIGNFFVITSHRNSEAAWHSARPALVLYRGYVDCGRCLDLVFAKGKRYPAQIAASGT